MSGIIELLETYGHGSLVTEGNESLEEVVEAMVMHGGEGEILIKIKLKSEGPTIKAFGGDVRIKKPKAEPPISVFFHTKKNTLQRSPEPGAEADLLRPFQSKGKDG